MAADMRLGAVHDQFHRCQVWLADVGHGKPRTDFFLVELAVKLAKGDVQEGGDGQFYVGEGELDSMAVAECLGDSLGHARHGRVRLALEGLARVTRLRGFAIHVTMARMKSSGLLSAVMISLRVMVTVSAPAARPFTSRKRSLPVLGPRDSTS